MRISTKSSFEIGTTTISRQQTELTRLQNQLATGKKVINPSDDPVAAAQVITVTKASALNDQTTNNRIHARNALSQQETIFTQVGEALQNSRELLTSARNPANDAGSLSYIAKQLQANYDTITGLANTTDANGLYLFSGYQGSEQPFVESTDNTQPSNYEGDGGKRTIQVGPARIMEIGTEGRKIFNKFEAPTGSFITQSSNLQQGSTGFIKSISVITATTAIDTKNITIKYIGDNQCEITKEDGTTESVTYIESNGTGGGTIETNGLKISLSGSIQQNDSFTIAQAAYATDQSMFSILKQAISTLNKFGDGISDHSQLDSALGQFNTQLDYSFNNVLTARASVGSRLAELDVLDTNAQDRKLQYAETLSALQDLDYTDAISEFSLRNTILEAAMKSFTQIQGLSLFKVI